MNKIIFASLFFFGMLIGNAGQTRTLESVISVKESQIIDLRGFHGAQLTVVSWDKPEVKISLTVTVSAGDDQRENEYLKQLSLTESSNPEQVTIVLEKPKDIIVDGFTRFFRWIFSGEHVSQELSGEISVPRNNALTSDMRYGTLTLSGVNGEVSLHGTGNAITISDCSKLREIDNNYGKIKIIKSGGTLELSSRSSDRISLEEFSGSASLDVDYSNVVIKNISKNLTINNVSGDINVANAGGDVHINANYSTIIVQDVAGTVDIESRSASMIRVENAKGLKVSSPYSPMELQNIIDVKAAGIEIDNQSGSIHLERVSGNIMIDANYSDIILQNIIGDVLLTTKSGTVGADSIRGNWRSSSEYSSITMTAIQASTISLKNSSNPILIDCSTNPTAVSIINTYGSVDLDLPMNYSGEIALEAKYGSIETDFPVKTKSQGSETYANGKVGSGNGKIEIETTSGNISVKQKKDFLR